MKKKKKKTTSNCNILLILYFHTQIMPGRVYPGQAYTLQKPVASAREMNVQFIAILSFKTKAFLYFLLSFLMRHLTINVP
ncbi:hypothetical protein ACJIZ3_021584 [Penstemon smallii]|uniref:Secreted protein n=1 Tax=Penstemon smallii TaxID=265156 RepID=A0ABD3SM28_9LAMI